MRKFCLGLYAFLHYFHSSSQDTQYWTQQFGTRSALLGGSIVGSVNDNTALYYNPGALGFIDTGSLSINANIYGIENIRIFNAAGNKADFRSSQVSTVPLLFGGMIPNRKNAWRFSYGLMAPVDFNFKSTARLDGNFAIVNDNESPGQESLIAQADLSTRVTEMLGGFGAGRQLNENWSIGITGFIGVRSQVYSRTLLARFYLNPGEELVTGNLIQNLNYYHVRFIPKLGVAWRKGQWDLGLTITAPSIALFGKGTVAADATGTNILPPSGDTRIDFLANDRQEKLKTTFKSPFSVSGGAAYSFGRSQINGTVAWYGKVAMYDIIRAKAAAFARPPDAYPELTSDEFLRVRTAARPVFNFAFGYEYILNPKVTLDISYRNDQTYFDTDLNDMRGIKPDLSSWDIHHFTVGGTIRKNRSELSVGLAISNGKDGNREQSGNLSKPSESNLLQGETTITEAKYSSFGFLLGYTYSFRKF
ncbi:hypothetical protein [Flavihumibacter petaseus]|uniref:Uncharacterized protein n=1 Tax=Flavihumibacter petaseus NBRC 106054 TaxID=1220578 RepID=A0A0E9MYF1_9BACT|nr:hypothetical protein [Flavihumibacter petaseus]GAO42619.1 hypothetical protein FPE01S_01_16340 [Flavihumibacter petaseus NBRC 106054]